MNKTLKDKYQAYLLALEEAGKEQYAYIFKSIDSGSANKWYVTTEKKAVSISGYELFYQIRPYDDRDVMTDRNMEIINSALRSVNLFSKETQIDSSFSIVKRAIKHLEKGEFSSPFSYRNALIKEIEKVMQYAQISFEEN